MKILILKSGHCQCYIIGSLLCELLSPNTIMLCIAMHFVNQSRICLPFFPSVLIWEAVATEAVEQMLSSHEHNHSLEYKYEISRTKFLKIALRCSAQSNAFRCPIYVYTTNALYWHFVARCCNDVMTLLTLCTLSLAHFHTPHVQIPLFWSHVIPYMKYETWRNTTEM